MKGHYEENDKDYDDIIFITMHQIFAEQLTFEVNHLPEILT